MEDSPFAAGGYSPAMGFSPSVSEHFLSGEEDDGQQQQPHNMSGNSGRRKGQRITEYIADRQLRFKSYLRRRPIPFKRVRELDASCGTRSILVQVGRDFDECLYSGPEELVEQFWTEEGLRMSNVARIIRRMRMREEPNDKPAAADFDIKPLKPTQSRASLPGLKLDDDYSPTVAERKRQEKAKQKELQPLTPTSEGKDVEKWKAFRSRRESLMAKIQETDSVCACQSFLLTVHVDKDVAFYHGDPELVSLFFSTGVSRRSMNRRINVRPFEPDEYEYNQCSVPHCIVSRNTLSKWRLAAIEMFKFPWDLPVMLHPCPENERKSWIAELDLDPKMGGKVSVCSLHFKEGRPTKRHPFPSELLREIGEDDDVEVIFTGVAEALAPKETVPGIWKAPVDKVLQSACKESLRFIQFSVKKKLLARRRRRTLQSCKETKSVIRKVHSTAFRCSRKIVARCHKNALRSKITCGRCRLHFVGNREYYVHFASTHRGKVDLQLEAREKEELPDCGDISDEDSKLVIDEGNVSPPEEELRGLQVAEPVALTEEEERICLKMLYPQQEAKIMNPKKKYVCAVCKSVCDLFGLFIHMKQVHQGILCQYCLKLFKKVSDLELHMKNVHSVRPRYFHSAKEFASFAGINYNFVCSTCSKIVLYKDLENHPCGGKMGKRTFDCPFCDRNFGFQSQLEQHLCNGWCKGMSWLKNPTSAETAKLYKVLTGIDLVKGFENQKQQQKKKAPKKVVFTVSDKQVLTRYNVGGQQEEDASKTLEHMLEGLPSNGGIYCGRNSKGMNNYVRKEIKDSGYLFDLASKLEDAKLSVGQDVKDLQITRAGKNFILHSPNDSEEDEKTPIVSRAPLLAIRPPSARRAKLLEDKSFPPAETPASALPLFLPKQQHQPPLLLKVGSALRPKKESKKERRTRIANEIYASMGRIKEAVEHFKEKCLFCQQTCFVSVDTVFLLSHLMIIHNPQDVNNILQEDPQHCINRIKKHLKDVRIRDSIFTFNLGEEFSFSEYRCCYCPDFTSKDYGELFSHVGEAHKSKVLTCHLCQNIFLNYGSYVSHVCFGPPSGGGQARAKFSCKVCRKQDLGTFLDFQFHLRKMHNLCEICLQSNDSQEQLYQHCQSHSQELMCMKCFLTYEEKLQFSKHLYYKHEEEHKVCKTCHQKTWPHVYHFCIRPQRDMVCEVCDTTFSDLKRYRVHMRTHTGANPYLCSAKNCSKSYISRQLLWKHQIRRHPEMRTTATRALEEKRNKRQMAKYGASNVEHVRLCEDIVSDLLKSIIVDVPKVEEVVAAVEAPEVVKEADPSLSAPVLAVGEAVQEEYDPIDAAVRSIMGPEGSFNTNRSPTKLSPARQEPARSVAAVSPAPPNFGSQQHSTFEPPQLIVRGPSGQSVHIQPHQIRSTVNAAQMMKAHQGGNIPIVRVGQVLPSFIPPPQRGANIRLPTFSVRSSGPRLHHPSSLGNPSFGPVAFPTKPLPLPSGPENPIDDSATDDASEQEDETQKKPVVSGIWNQDLMIISNGQSSKKKEHSSSSKTIKTLNPNIPAWDLMLSESSGSDNEEKPKKARIVEVISDRTICLRDHDYCYASYMAAQPPKEDLTEMGKILSNVAIGATSSQFSAPLAAAVAGDEKGSKKGKKRKDGKKKKKKKKRKKKQANSGSSSSSDSEANIDVTSPGVQSPHSALGKSPFRKSSGPRPKYHTPGASTGVTAVTARPCFSSSSDEEGGHHGFPRKSRGGGFSDDSSHDDVHSSDLDTDFEADELLVNLKQIQNKSRQIKPSAKAVEAQESAKMEKAETAAAKPTLKLKIKLPPKPSPLPLPPQPPPVHRARMINTSLNQKVPKKGTGKVSKTIKRKIKPPTAESPALHSHHQPLSKKMRDSLALNQVADSSSSGASSSSSSEDESGHHSTSIAMAPHIKSVASAAAGPPAFSDDRLYCVCQCPHDDVSEMIGCDAPDCRVEWFHFECVGIMVPPEGKWYCSECSKRYKIYG